MTTTTTTKGSLHDSIENEDEHEHDHDHDHETFVREAVQSVLTEKQREAVELFFFEGLSQSEIARRLGISQQVVQRRLYGAPRGGAVVGGAIAKLRVALTTGRGQPRDERRPKGLVPPSDVAHLVEP